MMRLRISPDDMEAERGAVLAEMHMYENYPTSTLLDAVMFASFLGHPYRNNTIGWESDIVNLKHEEVVAFYERHYQPANAVPSRSSEISTVARSVPVSGNCSRKCKAASRRRRRAPWNLGRACLASCTAGFASGDVDGERAFELLEKNFGDLPLLPLLAEVGTRDRMLGRIGRQDVLDAVPGFIEGVTVVVGR